MLTNTEWLEIFCGVVCPGPETQAFASPDRSGIPARTWSPDVRRSVCTKTVAPGSNQCMRVTASSFMGPGRATPAPICNNQPCNPQSAALWCKDRDPGTADRSE